MNELLRKILFLPEQRSTVALEIDKLHYFVISGTFIGAALVGLVAAVLLFRYRQTVRPYLRSTPHVIVPGWLETVFIIAMLGLFIFWWERGFRQYIKLSVAPDNAIEIYVTAKKWMWTFTYADGRGGKSVLVVPANRPVKLIMTSRDVIHSFFVPEFRVKQDVVPGRQTTVWFEATQPGRYEVFCTEFCGAGHSTMRAEIVALSAADYEAWLDGTLRPESAPLSTEMPAVVGEVERTAPLSLAAQGREVAIDRGCVRCHSIDGTPHIGPTWRGLYGRTERLTDGRTIVIDEAYLTESMMDPRAKVVGGFQPLMPSYQGILDPAETAALIEYIKSLEDADGR